MVEFFTVILSLIFGIVLCGSTGFMWYFLIDESFDSNGDVPFILILLILMIIGQLLALSLVTYTLVN